MEWSASYVICYLQLYICFRKMCILFVLYYELILLRLPIKSFNSILVFECWSSLKSRQFDAWCPVKIQAQIITRRRPVLLQTEFVPFHLLSSCNTCGINPVQTPDKIEIVGRTRALHVLCSPALQYVTYVSPPSAQIIVKILRSYEARKKEERENGNINCWG